MIVWVNLSEKGGKYSSPKNYVLYKSNIYAPKNPIVSVLIELDILFKSLYQT